MKLKTTLILLALVVAVAVFIKFFESKRPNTEEATRQAGNVLNFDREKLAGIIIQNGDDKIELRLRDNKWRVESPIKDQADNSAVSTLISDLESWHKDDTIPGKEITATKGRLEEYGLSKPKLRLKLLGPGMPPEIFFGKDTALEGRMYVRFENSKETLIAANSVRNEIAKKPEDFRDRKLTELTTAQVSRALVKTPAGEMELQKKTDHWEILKPLRARADDQKVGDLLAQVTSARIEKFVADDRGDLHPYGLAEPRGSITLFTSDEKSAGKTESSRGEQGQVLQIGAVPEKDKEQVYVRFSSRNAVYTLPKKIEEILNTKPNDLRDRHLIRFETNVLDRITVEAAGKNKVVLARKNDNWTIATRNNQPANADEVNRLIERLKNELVTKFVADVASEVGKYGLDKPQLQLTLSSFASENTAETKSGEQPFAIIAFGKIEGDDVYARVGDEPFIVAVKRNLLDKIFTDPLQWQDVFIFRFKPEQVHRLSVVTDREQSITRGPKNEWKWIAGNGPINQTNVQSLLNTLTSLHAVRWVGAVTPAHGFDKAQVAITFTTSPDDKNTHKLLIGASNGEGMWFARTDERDGAFVISNPDLDAFKLPIANAPSPTVTPGNTASPAPAVMATPTASPAH
jgi:ribosomal protein L20A (L18A)